ncbi:hypothetical protein SELMODRAFT_417659 [Selaginella moellendorffii]|uniref:Uncharacterized protein n=1 Tax=Selaginella moellendorffii TaxID=88036 RepID=D8S359_SELML|nr:hypothetical protein SELMODRAFT_417659 [Selaginella moellendorffii]
MDQVSAPAPAAPVRWESYLANTLVCSCTKLSILDPSTSAIGAAFTDMLHTSSNITTQHGDLFGALTCNDQAACRLCTLEAVHYIPLWCGSAASMVAQAARLDSIPGHQLATNHNVPMAWMEHLAKHSTTFTHYLNMVNLNIGPLKHLLYCTGRGCLYSLVGQCEAQHHNGIVWQPRRIQHGCERGFQGRGQESTNSGQDDHQNPRQDDQQQQNHEQELQAHQEISLLLLLVPFVIGAGDRGPDQSTPPQLGSSFATHEVSPSRKFEVKCSKVSTASKTTKEIKEVLLILTPMFHEKSHDAQYFVIINMLSFEDRESFAICVELHVQERKHQEFKHFKLCTNIVFNLKTIKTVHSFIDNGARLCTLEALRAIRFWCGPAASVSYTAAACRVQYGVVKTTSWASWIIRQGNWFIRVFKFH